MDKTIAIYDTDVSYAARFIDFIQKNNTGFDLMLFTNIDKLRDFVKYRKIEILLISDEQSADNFTIENIKYVIYLGDKNTIGKNPDNTVINKYQSVKKVISEILSCYTRFENDSGCIQKGKVSIISIYSPDLFKPIPEFAWSLAVSLSQQKKLLFLPLDLFPSVFTNLSETDNPDLSEFIYYLKENNPNTIIKMKSLLKYSGKLAYLCGLTHGLDLISLTKEDADRWLDELIEGTDFEAVIIYLGIFTEASLEIINRSDCVYLPKADNAYEEQVWKEWERQMEFINISTQYPKFRKIVLPKEEGVINPALSVQKLYSDLILQIKEQLDNNLWT